MSICYQRRALSCERCLKYYPHRTDLMSLPEYAQRVKTDIKLRLKVARPANRVVHQHITTCLNITENGDIGWIVAQNHILELMDARA